MVSVIVPTPPAFEMRRPMPVLLWIWLLVSVAATAPVLPSKKIPDEFAALVPLLETVRLSIEKTTALTFAGARWMCTPFAPLLLIVRLLSTSVAAEAAAPPLRST